MTTVRFTWKWILALVLLAAGYFTLHRLFGTRAGYFALQKVIVSSVQGLREDVGQAANLNAPVPKEEEDWERKTCHLEKLTNTEQVFDYIYNIRLPCENPVMVGGQRSKKGELDGEKWVCMSKKFNVVRNKCVVYSFGIGGDWTFDDDMDKMYGCKVYSFDHTLGLDDHNRSENIRFFNLGISDVKKARVDRYVNILKSLGHLSTTIDVLKIDVEGAELQFFEDVLISTPNLLKNVKMLAMEIHLPNLSKGIPSNAKRFWKYFQLLDCLGFKIWHSDINARTPRYKLRGKVRTCCYEVVWAQDRQW